MNLLDAHSHEPAEGMDDSSDVIDGLGEPLHEEIFEEMSHDLIRAEDIIMSTCMEIFASSKDPLSDLYAIFPYLIFDDSASFICNNCDSVSICQICAEIKACQRGDALVPRDCDVACADNMIDDLAMECQDSAWERSSLIHLILITLVVTSLVAIVLVLSYVQKVQLRWIII